MKKLSPGSMAAAAGMSAAVALLMLFSAGITRFAALSVVCLFVASLMTWIPLREESGYVWALLEFASVTLLSLLISRGSVYTYLYILLFGPYAIERYFLRTHIGDRLLTVLIRFLILNVMAASGIAFAEFVLEIDVLSYLPETTVLFQIGLLEGAFGIFMLLFKVFSLLFDSVIRNVLLPRR